MSTCVFFFFLFSFFFFPPLLFFCSRARFPNLAWRAGCDDLVLDRRNWGTGEEEGFSELNDAGDGDTVSTTRARYIYIYIYMYCIYVTVMKQEWCAEARVIGPQHQELTEAALRTYLPREYGIFKFWL